MEENQKEECGTIAFVVDETGKKKISATIGDLLLKTDGDQVVAFTHQGREKVANITKGTMSLETTGFQLPEQFVIFSSSSPG